VALFKIQALLDALRASPHSPTAKAWNSAFGILEQTLKKDLGGLPYEDATAPIKIPWRKKISVVFKSGFSKNFRRGNYRCLDSSLHNSLHKVNDYVVKLID